MNFVSRFVAVSFLFGATFAVEKPCCMSKRWMGKMQITTGFLINGSTVPVITQNTFMIDYDRDMRMERVMGENYVVNGTVETTYNYTVYNDFRHMRRYVLALTADCEIEHLKEDQIASCVPSTLQHSGTFSVGSLNTNGTITVNAWTGVWENFHYSMLTTVDDCTPVSTTRFGTDEHGTRITESMMYADVTQYVTSMHAFELPSQCKKGDMAVGK